MSEDRETDPKTDERGVESPPDELTTETIDEAERLTRLARNANDSTTRTAYRERRNALIGPAGYGARVREERDRSVLVLYPDEWFVEGIVDTERIDDIDRAVERPLTEGTGTETDWESIAAHNDSIAAQVTARYGSVHGANAEAFAAFMSNHYARLIGTAGPGERSEFLTEYFPRNAWPTDEQKAVIEESIERVFTIAEDRDEPNEN